MGFYSTKGPHRLSVLPSGITEQTPTLRRTINRARNRTANRTLIWTGLRTLLQTGFQTLSVRQTVCGVPITYLQVWKGQEKTTSRPLLRASGPVLLLLLLGKSTNIPIYVQIIKKKVPSLFCVLFGTLCCSLFGLING